MVILGVSDVPAQAATVVVDDVVVAAVSGEQLGLVGSDDAVPWPVVDAALATAGVGAGAVDVVAVAGRFSPSLPLRQRPWLRRFASSPFSPLLDAQVIWQAVLRHSGMGAYAADVAAEWLEDRFAQRGFTRARLLTVDTHKAIAEAAYRMQPDDDVLVVALQPMGDGVGLSVHRGRGAQLDRLWVQRGFESVHTHLPRVLAAAGIPASAPHRLGELAARGTPDPELSSLLAADLHAEGRRLSRLGRTRPLASDPLFARIRALPQADAAASIHANLVHTVTTLVRRHVAAHGLGKVALAGEAFDDPRLVAHVALARGVTQVTVLPRPGRDALALGAAVAQAGLAPGHRGVALGPAPDADACAAALDGAGLTAVRKATLIDRLCRGEALVRFRDRPGPGRHGMGHRCVLVRADDALALQRVRGALGLPDHEEPLVLVIPTPNEGAVDGAARLVGPLAAGLVAPGVDAAWKRRYGASVAPDGRMWMRRLTADAEPGLHALITALLRASGCGALAAFPLAIGDGPPAATPQEAVEVFRRGGFGALQLGDFYVEASSDGSR